MSQRKCFLCGEVVVTNVTPLPALIQQAFPNATPLPGVGDGHEFGHHMALHGFVKQRVNNTGRTDESYYCVVVGSEVAGRTFQFGDRVDTSAKPFRYYPAALLGTEDQVQTSGYVEGMIELNDPHNGR